MEANNFKQRLNDSLNSNSLIKVVFQYPSSIKCKIHIGKVKKVSSDSFDFLDRFNGLMTFSYSFICEISEVQD